MSDDNTQDAAEPSLASAGSHGFAIAFTLGIIMIASVFAFGVFAFWLMESGGVTAEDIDTLKDAAAIIGPGEPIARDLWRLAERLEGK
jgi:hypothetical protein